MGNRLAALLVLIAVAVGGYFVYRHFQERKAEDSGEVTCQGCMTPEQKASFEKEDHGDTPDGQSEHKQRTAMADDRAGFPDANATVNGTPGTQAGATAQAVSASPEIPATQPAAAPPMAQPASGPMPAMDSQSPNAPNGMRFGGSGTYQWYRQGNLTWRVDTASGRSCIIYATMEEWQKQIVLSHGCGREA